MSNPASSSLTPAERRQQAIRAKVLRNSNNRLSHLLGTVGKEEINTGLVEEEEIHVPPLPLLSEGVLSSPPSVTRDDLPPPEPSPSPPPPASAIIPPPLSSTSEPQQATSNALLQSTGWILLGFLTRALLVLFPFLNAFFIFSITAFSLNILQLLNFSAPPPNNSSEVSFLRVACLIFLDSRTNDKVFAALRSLQHFLFAFSLFFFSFIVLDSCL